MKPDPDWKPFPLADALFVHMLRGAGVGFLVFAGSSVANWIASGRPRFARFMGITALATPVIEGAATMIDQAYERRVRHNMPGGWVKPAAWIATSLVGYGAASRVAFRTWPSVFIAPATAFVVDSALIALFKPWEPGPTIAQVSSLLDKGEVKLREHISVIKARIDQAH